MQVLDPKKIPGSVEITLEGDRRVWMRRPKVQDQLSVSHIENHAENEIALIANLTMLTKDEIVDLWWEDYLLLQEVLKGFLFPKKANS